jgi:hypothetical protein
MNEQHIKNIGKAMECFYNYSIVQKMTIDGTREIIRSIEEDLIAVYPAYAEDEDDYRLGKDTYGYESDASILGSLSYISDRWGAAFRIAWMLGIVNRDYR